LLVGVCVDLGDNAARGMAFAWVQMNLGAFG